MIELENISCVLPQTGLSTAQRTAMFELLGRHFDGVAREQFERDLAAKSHVILLHRDARLVGFSTLLAYESSLDGEPVSVIYSGDTIVAPEAWGTSVLAKAWIGCVRGLRERYPRGRFYWLLLTSGFRTYRFLPVFWREFHPCFNVAIPSTRKRLLDHLAGEQFGAQYHSTEGVVRFIHPQRLRHGLEIVPAGRAADPHVAFFLSRNPRHADGDELVCLTELGDENLTAAGRRMVEVRRNESLCHPC